MMRKARQIATMMLAVTDPQKLRTVLGAIRAYDRAPPATCPACGYAGKFASSGLTNRARSRCPQCGSHERHRLFVLAGLDFGEKSVLHFAPEPVIRRWIRSQHPARYKTADIEQGRADLVLNIESIDLPSDSYDRVVCSHVLEHVDDSKAISELYRIVAPGGQLIAMVPIIDGWDTTYEDPAITDPAEREAHFAQHDHVRYYGSDFRDRLRAGGFDVSEVTAGGADSVRYALTRGGKVFVATKPQAG